MIKLLLQDILNKDPYNEIIRANRLCHNVILSLPVACLPAGRADRALAEESNLLDNKRYFALLGMTHYIIEYFNGQQRSDTG